MYSMYSLLLGGLFCWRGWGWEGLAGEASSVVEGFDVLLVPPSCLLEDVVSGFDWGVAVADESIAGDGDACWGFC